MQGTVADFTQRQRNDNYVQDQIVDERVHMSYEAMNLHQRPEFYAPNIDALMHGVGPVVPNGTHLGLHKYPRPSDATPVERFSVITSANDPFPLHAKIGMKKLNIGQGDMLDMDKRYANMRWAEQNMTRDGGEDETSSTKVNTVKAATKPRLVRNKRDGQRK
jgi:hypothetical protein